MPRIFEWHGYRFFFFSNEGDPPERCHVHICKGGEYMKVWIDPQVELDRAYGINSKQINKLIKVTIENRDLIKEKWDEHINR
ncbi:MAG: DUF4160 domain-containing protein [Planctomycetes bacterium]|nr:DUF4160 domain-containing protein [Planctomycetota bacterium]